MGIWIVSLLIGLFGILGISILIEKNRYSKMKKVIDELERTILDQKVTVEVETANMKETFKEMFEKFKKSDTAQKKVVKKNIETSPKKNDDIAVPYQAIKRLYNTICVDLPNVRKLSQSRKRHIKARWKEKPDIKWWERLFKYIQNNDFLAGRRVGWRANFDWIMKQSNFIKIIEGNYDNGKQDISKVNTGFSNKFDNEYLSPQTIKDLRMKLGLNEKQMADLLGVTFGSIFNWEAGRNKPSEENLKKIIQLKNKVESQKNTQDFNSWKLKAKRLEAGLTQKELGELVGKTKSAIKHYENDGVEPSGDILIKLEQLLGDLSDKNNNHLFRT